MPLKPLVIINAEDMNASITSDPFWVDGHDIVTFLLDWGATSSPDGDIALQASDDLVEGREGSADWRDVVDNDGNVVTLKSPDGTTTTGKYAQVFRSLTGPYRLKWTRTAGTSSDKMTVKVRRSAEK